MITYPFTGTFKVTSTFGTTRTYKNRYGKWITDKHEGIDIVGISNRNVVSITEGTVGFVKNTGTSGYGLHVWVKNDDGTGSLYAHLSSVNVKAGDNVSAGSKIGVMGQTGNSTGPHLHLEVHTTQTYAYNKNLMDPSDYLNMGYNQLGGSEVQGGGEVKGASDITIASSSTSGLLDTVVTDGKIYKVTGAGSFGGYPLYGRKYRILISDKDGNSVNVSNLRCKFEVNKVSYNEPCYSIITIYNLSASSENQIITNAFYVIVEAGYESGGHYGMIFKGQVVQPIRGKENGTDYFLKLVCIDNQRYMTYANMCNTYVANQTMRQVVEQCINNPINPDMKAIAGNISIVDSVYPRGKVLFGNASKYLDQIARTSNASLYYDQDKVNIVKAAEIPQDEVVSLTPSSGLIGTPSQVTTSVGGIGIQAKCLLNPLITTGSMVHLENVRIVAMQYDFTKNTSGYRPLDNEGLYRIIKLVHSGDTRDNDWYTDFEAVSQAGAMPGVMSAESMYPW